MEKSKNHSNPASVFLESPLQFLRASLEILGIKKPLWTYNSQKSIPAHRKPFWGMKINIQHWLHLVTLFHFTF